MMIMTLITVRLMAVDRTLDSFGYIIVGLIYADDNNNLYDVI